MPQLLRISVFQRMKANHNFDLYLTTLQLVVTNLSISKNESKSQRVMKIGKNISCCYESQYFKE